MKQPKTYTAPHPVYQGGVYYHPGVPFTTNEPRGDEWEEEGGNDKAADIAADKLTHEDVNLDELDVSALRTLAAAKGINLGEAKAKKDIITVIKAADEPTL